MNVSMDLIEEVLGGNISVLFNMSNINSSCSNFTLGSVPQNIITDNTFPGCINLTYPICVSCNAYSSFTFNNSQCKCEFIYNINVDPNDNSTLYISHFLNISI